MKLLILLSFISFSVWSKGNTGPVFSVSFSPKANKSKLTRSDTQTETTYVGNQYKATLGYRFETISILGNVVKSDSENEAVSTQTRDDLNYGATLRFTPFQYFYLQSTYWITNTELGYENLPSEKFVGDKLTAGAGIRIPMPAGPAFTISGTYILSSKFRRKDGGDADVAEEEGYTLSFGGTLTFTY